MRRFLNRTPYNRETRGETLRSFRQIARRRIAHCAEATLFAATVLEQHGYPPLVLSIESTDYLDHVIYLYRHRGRWGTIARSRDPGLHGRKPVFRTVRALAMSYIDEYIDATACVQAFARFDLRNLRADWLSKKCLVVRARVDQPAPHAHHRATRPPAQDAKYRIQKQKTPSSIADGRTGPKCRRSFCRYQSASVEILCIIRRLACAACSRAPARSR